MLLNIVVQFVQLALTGLGHTINIIVVISISRPVVNLYILLDRSYLLVSLYAGPWKCLPTRHEPDKGFIHEQSGCVRLHKVVSIVVKISPAPV